MNRILLDWGCSKISMVILFQSWRCAIILAYHFVTNYSCLSMSPSCSAEVMSQRSINHKPHNGSSHVFFFPNSFDFRKRQPGLICLLKRKASRLEDIGCHSFWHFQSVNLDWSCSWTLELRKWCFLPPLLMLDMKVKCILISNFKQVVNFSFPVFKSGL